MFSNILPATELERGVSQKWKDFRIIKPNKALAEDARYPKNFPLTRKSEKSKRISQGWKSPPFHKNRIMGAIIARLWSP